MEKRKEKKRLRKINGSGLAVYKAYIYGQKKGALRKRYLNPFPVGKRHDDYSYGYYTGLIESERHY